MAIGRRRAPWPYGIIVDGTPIPLVGGTFKGSKVSPFSDIVPTTQSYENWPAFRERTLAWSSMPLGYGHGFQIQDNPEKDAFYSYAIGVDASIATVWQKGPLVTRVTPASTGPIAGFAEVSISGTKTMFAIAGQYALKRTGDTSVGWPVSQNLATVGFRPEVVTQNVGSSSTKLIVGVTGANPWIFDATAQTWAQNAALLGYKFLLLSDTRELYAWTGANNMAKVDVASDFTNIANWTAADNFRVGDATQSITELARTTHNALLIIKQDGIFTLRDDGQALDLFPGLRGGTDANNGLGWFQFEGSTYVPTVNTGLLKMTPSGFYGSVVQAQETGVEKLGDNNSPVKGRITAGEGSQFNGYAGILNPDTGNSYLLKLGGRAPNGDFIPAWHGSITQAFAGVSITAMKRSTVGAPAGHERMYLGFSDGSIGWFILPCTANPSNCSAYLFDTVDAQIYMPLAHLGFKADRKTVEAFSVFGPSLGGDHYVRVACRFDTSGSYQDVGNAFTDPGGSRQDFTTPLVGFMVDVQVTLSNPATNTLSPQVASVAVHHKVLPALVIEYEGVADGRPNPRLRDGHYGRRPPEQVKAALESAAGSAFSTWVTEDERSVTVSMHEYAFQEAQDVRYRRIGWLIPFKAVAYRTNTIYGTWARIQVNSWKTLQSMNWSQIQTL